MVHRLLAGKHYGRLLQQWESQAFTLSAIRHGARTKTPLHTNELATLVFVLNGGYLKKVNGRTMRCEKHFSMKRLRFWIVLLVTTLTCTAASTNHTTPMECEQEIIEARQHPPL